MKSICRLLPVFAAISTPVFADASNEAATSLFKAAFHQSCVSAFTETGDLADPPQRFDLTMEWSFSDPEPVVLWQFTCVQGAYNRSDIFILKSEVDGLMALGLAQPALKVEYDDPEDFESPVKSVAVAGWAAHPMAVNPNFDAATGLLSTHSAWRGIGDAYSAGVWKLKDGGFQLTHFEVDASYDGEANPQLELDFP